jgi:hypothetical protein
MAVTYRGLYLVGNKRAKTVRAVQIVDAGLADILRSGYRNIFHAGLSRNTKRCRGRKI